jgi:transposase
MPNRRKPCPSDFSDDKSSLVAPYLMLTREDAAQREHPLRELLSGLRFVIRNRIAGRAMPNDLPPWFAVYQQAQRWRASGCFGTLAHDFRAVLRLAAGRTEEPSAAIIESPSEAYQ